LASLEAPDERWLAVTLASIVAGLILILALRGAVALLRCRHDPRRLAPGQSAVAGVAAVGLALAAIALGGVIAPLLRAEEARLLSRNERLQVDPESGFSGLELSQMRVFLDRLGQ
jgi:hypothetical protein